MKCKAPFTRGLSVMGCGQCLPCRINRSRLWTIRLMLEAGQHEHNSFVTLTYDQQNLPPDGSVTVREAQLFLKRLRKSIGSFRYFIVGEYGERTWRPHYHAVLFGVRDGCGVASAWNKGFVHISGVGVESAGYVAGYCLKGLTTEKGMRWAGRELKPEFCRMSLRPGLGASAAVRMKSFYSSETGRSVLQRDLDVSHVVRQGGKLWPLGRYLRGIVRGSKVRPASMQRDCQLGVQERLLSMSQDELNAWIVATEDVAARSGLRAEAFFKRKSLERRVKL